MTPQSLILLRTQPPATPSPEVLAVAEEIAATAEQTTVGVLGLVNTYAPLLLAAFFVTLLVTPLVRRLAISLDLVDHPDAERKNHRMPVPYLGGLAVFAGIAAAIGLSYLVIADVPERFAPVPIAVIVGLLAITFTGLADDVWGWDPRLKIAGQLVAAAALAIENIGVKVAAGVLAPVADQLGIETLAFAIPLPGNEIIPIDLVYWTGTALIAIFVLGGCNAANLLDGLDGLLSGTTAIVAAGLLAISLLMAVVPLPGGESTLDGARLVLSFALLGAVLGFLPHNFNPASIFLGDCGSLLLGYVCVVIILMFGETGQTHLVFAGLIIFSLPIMDTTLAIIRRKLAGSSMSAADDQHIHHQLRRALGGVKRAVFALYGISLAFAAVGVTLAALVTLTDLRVRVIYVIVIMLFGFIAVIAVKAARRVQMEKSLASKARKRAPATKPEKPVASNGDEPRPKPAIRR